MNAFNQIYQDFISILFPNLCYACDKPIYHSEAGICINCLAELPFTNFHHDPENSVEKVFWGRIKAEAATTLFYFHAKSKVQHLIHQLKYKNKPEIGFLLGKMLGHQLQKEPRFKDIDGIVAVPLHPDKIKKRGYNQAEKIANGLGEIWQIPVLPNLLKRGINTETQTKKSRFDRYLNMKEVFYIDANQKMLPKKVLIVDDVVTTGSTIESCAIALQEANIQVFIAALAFAER